MPPNTRDPCANGNANVDARTRAASTLNSTRKGSSTNMMNDHAFITSSNGNKDNRKGIRGRNEDIDSSSDLGELLLPITLPNNSNNCSRHLSSSSSSSSAVSIPRQVLTMVKSAPVLAITGSHFSNNFGGFMMLSWLPSMLKDEFGLDGTALWVSCLPYLAYLVGAAVGGYAAVSVYVQFGLPALSSATPVLRIRPLHL